MRKLLALLLLLPLLAQAGTVTGNIQTASSGAVVNGTLTFTLNQFAVVSGTAQVVATGVQCYTSTAGAITGEPDPQTAPVLSVNLGSGTLAAGTYFVKYTYFDGSGESLPSPEASVTLVSPGTVIVAVPAIQPANATGWRVYISAATGTETRQSSQTGFAASYQQTAALSAGTALPGTNTSACSMRFTDEMIPSTTYYTINLVNSLGSKIAGYPISQARFYGGTNGSVNVSSGWPVSIGGVIWPSPIVSTPNSNATQSIAGGLSLGTFPLTAGNGTFSGGTLNGTYGGNPTLSGNVSVGGTLGGCVTNGVRIVGSSCYATIAACYAAASAGETCQIPPNYAETLAANLVLSKKKTTLKFMGACAINEGAFNVQVSQGADDVSIITPFAHSSDQAGGNQGCMFLGYTGSGAAIDIGSSAGFTYNTLIRGVVVDLSSAQASAIGIRRTNGVSGPLEYDEVVGGAVSGQIGFQFVGTGALFDGTSNLVGLECNYSTSSTNGKCVQFTGVNQNGYAFVGGHSNTGGSANGSVCIDAAAGSSKIDLGGFYCDVAATGVTVESTANTAVRGWFIVDSGVTLVANFAAGSNGNRIETNTRSIGSQLVTDSGTANTNSATNGFDMQWNSRRWRVVSEAGAAGFQIVDQSDNAQVIAKGVGGATHIDSSAGNPTRINQNTGDGFEVWKSGAAIFVVDTTSGTTHPGAVNTAGLGTAALPWVNLKLGNAATNNITLTGVATGARTATFQDATGTVPLIIASGTSTFTTTAVGAGACQTTVTTAATNALTSDTITTAYTSAPGAATDSLLILNKWPTAGNVNFSRCNPTAGSITPTALVLNWRVIR